MSSDRRRSQPDILESTDQKTLFYSSNYSSANYCSVYASSNLADGGESESPQYSGTKNYSMVPRMGRRASKELNTKYYKRDSSRSDGKKDYQDIYKDRKTTAKPNIQTENVRRISVDTGSVITTVPTIPSRKYSRDEDYASYDDLIEETTPPKLAPVSGFLTQNAGRAVVRPIAFKPVVSNKMSSSSGYRNNSPDNYAYEKPHADDGYSSQESRACSHNGTMRDSYGYDARPASYDSSQYREQRSGDCYQMTPSPTNNSAHYEQLIQEKERELTTLRDTMEANERVIFQVNEEKRLNWENQMKELTSEYHRRLRLQQDRAYKSEKELQDKINKLQKDNQKMSKERDQLSIEKDHNSHMQEQLKVLRHKNEELSNRLTSASCDCELLRQQDQDKQKQVEALEELVTIVKAENMNLSNELDEKRRQDRQSEKTTPNSERELDRLKQLLAGKENALQAERDQFIYDRELWEKEKKKVLQYQRQLQSNYIQMCRRNSELEKHLPQSSRLHNNNNIADKQQLPGYSVNSQEKCSFKAQLEATPESLC